jgi:hypothetical protein
MNNFMSELEKQTNYSETEKGALGFATTLNKLLDINFAVSSLRNMPDSQVAIMFRQAYGENKELALKWLFYARDVRGGLGERRLFRVAVNDIAKDLDERVINWIIEYGRYDDLFALYDTHLKPSIVGFIKKQLKEDEANMTLGKPTSLLAKWMPSENTSSRQTVALAKKVIADTYQNPKGYRKILSTLRKYIDVTEVKMSKSEWSEINYEDVPSRANLIYNKAFLKNDEYRRREFLGKVEKGEAKINAGVLFPHDILHKYGLFEYGFGKDNGVDLTVEALWKGLPNYLNDEESTIVVCDGSGSMAIALGNTKITAIEVAGALAIYFSERCKGQYKDKFITFSCNPQLVDLTGLDTLHKKWSKLQKYNEVANTNIEKVFDLLLKTALSAKMQQKDIPNVLIISDMEFDQASVSKDADRLMETVEKKWADAGYDLPRLAFWNTCGRTLTVPIIKNKQGLKLVSGFSPAIVNQVLSPHVSPLESLLAVLLSERYKQITNNK